MTSIDPSATQAADTKAKRKKLRSRITDALMILLILVLLFVAQPVPIKGSSMNNTVKSGEIVLMNKLAYGKGTKNMAYGDVVICHYPGRYIGKKGNDHKDPLIKIHQNFIKRLVAMPGDTVEIRDHVLYVNGEAVPDPDTLGSLPGNYTLRTLGEDEYFVIGDDRATSHDSRSSDVGPISRDMIVGKAVCVIFPFRGWRGID